MKIGLIQPNVVADALNENGRALIETMASFTSDSVDLWLAPELALCGPNLMDGFSDPQLGMRCRAVLQQMAVDLHARQLPPLLLGAALDGIIAKSPGSCWDVAVLLHDGVVSTVASKASFGRDGIQPEQMGYFEAGKGPAILCVGAFRYLVVLGEDVFSLCPEEAPFVCSHGEPAVFASSLDSKEPFKAGEGVDAVLHLAAFSYAPDRITRVSSYLASCASRMQAPVVFLNHAGGQDGIVYYGSSIVLDRKGTCLKAEPLAVGSSVVVDLDSPAREALPVDSGYAALWQVLVAGTRDFVRKCGFGKIVLGLSGGIDSAVVAVIAAAALGPENVTVLLLPSQYSSSGSIDDSLELVDRLGMQHYVVPITPVLDTYSEVFSEIFAQPLQGLAEENIQARIRGALLMAYANQFGGMLLTTSNKSEIAVGYCTLYGDMNGGLGPIGDLYKTRVYGLAHWLSEHSTFGIPRAILEKEPSAELRADQRDADSLPPYPILDAILEAHIENKKNIAEILSLGYDKGSVLRIISLTSRAEFKRSQAALMLQASSKPFVRCRKPVARKN